MPDSYSESAVRHFADAELLAGSGRIDGAGHLIGLAVECAIKHVVASMRPEQGSPHVHLPKLIEQAKKALRGRTRFSILTVLHGPNFMGGWIVDLRYGHTGSTSQAQFDAWRKDAGRAMSAAGLRRSGR